MDEDYHALDVRPLIKAEVIQRAQTSDKGSVAIPNAVFDVMFQKLALKPAEQALYLQFYRNSYGRGLNCAQISTPVLCRLCNLSHSTVRTTVHTLCRKGCIEQARCSIQHDSPIYRVSSPFDLLPDYDRETMNTAPLPPTLYNVGRRLLRFEELSRRTTELRNSNANASPLSETSQQQDSGQQFPSKDQPSEGEARDDRGMV